MSSTQMDALSTQSISTSSFTSWIQAHPIMAHSSLAYAGTRLLEPPMVLGREGFGLFPYSVPLVPRLKRCH